MMRSLVVHRFWFIIAIALCFVSCGDPLVEGDYRGQPLIEIGGTILVKDAISPADAERVRIALLWVGADQQSELAQGRSESASVARYRLKVYALPPARGMKEVPDRKGLYAVARIVAYVDQDQNEMLGIDERIVGASADQVLTYFTSSEPTKLVRGNLQSGYQVMELLDCDESLEDKASLATVATQSQVNVTLEKGIAEGLRDIDCDTVGDDYCYDLRLQLQEDPENEALLQVYRDTCDVDYDPTFNNSTAETTNTTEEEQPTEEEDVPLCERDPDHPDCQQTQEEEEDPEVIAECKPLLSQITNGEFSHEHAREVYWQFSQCTGFDNPCLHVGWFGGETRWREFQACIFEEFPDHHTEYCDHLSTLLLLTEEEDSYDLHRLLLEEYDIAQCG